MVDRQMCSDVFDFLASAGSAREHGNKARPSMSSAGSALEHANAANPPIATIWSGRTLFLRLVRTICSKTGACLIHCKIFTLGKHAWSRYSNEAVVVLCGSNATGYT